MIKFNSNSICHSFQTLQFDSKMTMVNVHPRVFWSKSETKLLLSILEKCKICNLLEIKNIHRHYIFEIVEKELNKHGIYDKKPYNIHVKWKNMKKEYLSVKKVNEGFGIGTFECPYFDEIDRMMREVNSGNYWFKLSIYIYLINCKFLNPINYTDKNAHAYHISLNSIT